MITVNVSAHPYNYSRVIRKREYALLTYGPRSLTFAGDKMRFVGGCERENLPISTATKLDN